MDQNCHFSRWPPIWRTISVKYTDWDRRMWSTPLHRTMIGTSFWSLALSRYDAPFLHNSISKSALMFENTDFGRKTPTVNFFVTPLVPNSLFLSSTRRDLSDAKNRVSISRRIRVLPSRAAIKQYAKNYKSHQKGHFWHVFKKSGSIWRPSLRASFLVLTEYCQTS